MLPPWTPDIAIDAPTARALIAEQFDEFRAAPIEPFGFGWDNTAFLLDARAVFRFPRRTRMARLIEREIALLPIIAAALPERISAPRYAGRATERFAYPFAGYELLAGSTACRLSLDDEQRERLAEPLARFLRALHAIDTPALVARGLPPDELGRLDGAKRIGASLDRLAVVRSATHGDEVTNLETCVDWLRTSPPIDVAAGARTLVHGDLYPRHLIVRAGPELCGIIDWGDMHLGDPALDLSIAHAVLPTSAHERFRASYGRIDERTWRAARFRAIYHALLEVDYGARENDAAMHRSGAYALATIGAFLRQGRR